MIYYGQIIRKIINKKLLVIRTAGSDELAIVKSAKMTTKLKEMADFLLGLCHGTKRLFCRTKYDTALLHFWEHLRAILAKFDDFLRKFRLSKSDLLKVYEEIKKERH